MTIAIMSDIHSNPKAFKTALDDARENKCEKVVCLGDVVGYGYDPLECIHILTEDVPTYGLGMLCVLGNHDAAMCGKLPIDWFNSTAAQGVRRQMKILGKSDRQWLDGLEYTLTERFPDGLTAFYAHGAYVPEFNPTLGELDKFPYMVSLHTAGNNFKAMREDGQSLNNVLFVGHTHGRMIWGCKKRVKDGIDASLPEDGETVDISRGGWIINAGSVGYPRLEPFTSYVIFDSDRKTVEFRKLDFRFRDYVSQMKERSIPIPEWMSRWYDSERDLYYGEDGWTE